MYVYVQSYTYRYGENVNNSLPEKYAQVSSSIFILANVRAMLNSSFDTKAERVFVIFSCTEQYYQGDVINDDL